MPPMSIIKSRGGKRLDIIAYIPALLKFLRVVEDNAMNPIINPKILTTAAITKKNPANIGNLMYLSGNKATEVKPTNIPRTPTIPNIKDTKIKIFPIFASVLSPSTSNIYSPQSIYKHDTKNSLNYFWIFIFNLI